MYIIIAVLFLGMAIYYFIMAKDVAEIKKQKKQNQSDKTENKNNDNTENKPKG